MLNTIKATIERIEESSAPQVSPHVSPQVKELLLAMKNEMSREKLQAILRLTDRKSFRQRYLKPALAINLIEMTLPDKPNSRLQQYRLTEAGQSFVNSIRLTIGNAIQ